jgi:hypothetical protein
MFYGNYYLDEIDEVPQLKDYFNTDKKKFCIFRESNFQDLMEDNKDLKLYVYYDKKIGSRGIILASNYPPDTQCLTQQHIPEEKIPQK